MVYLREITLDDKGEILEMIDEINRDTLEDKFEGFRHLAKVNSDNYEDYLIELEHNKNMKLYKPEYEDQTTFVLVDDNNHIYGGVDIRHKLNDNLLKFGGNIGYLIRPSERRKGYGTLILKLVLKECKKLGMKKVLVSCREENIWSAKIIEKNNGKYENSRYKEDNNNTYRRYWIEI